MEKAKIKSFKKFRSKLADACLGCIDEQEPLAAVECDASDFVIAAILNQNE